MEPIIFLAVFAFVFILVYNIFRYKQKKYSGLEIRSRAEETKPDLEITQKQEKQGLRGILAYLIPLVQKGISRKSREGLARNLVTAGKPLTIVEYYAFVLLSSGIFFILGITGMRVFSQKPRPLIPLISLIVGYYLPGVWLRRKVKKRQQQISKDLPSVIDLLNLCVGSGIDFMLAVHRVIKDYKSCPVTEELAMLWQENNMGTPRKEALRNLSWRVNLPEMSSFVSTLIQADKMGTPISDALEIQAEQIRIRRFQKGEENALKAPIKLLLPLIFFILPEVAIIVAAPIILQFLKGGIKF